MIVPLSPLAIILAGFGLSGLFGFVLFAAVYRMSPRVGALQAATDSSPGHRGAGSTGSTGPTLRHHVIIVAAGHVGRPIIDRFRRKRAPFIVIDKDPKRVQALRSSGMEAIAGSALDPDALTSAKLESARRLIVAIPNISEALSIAECARRRNRDLVITVCAPSDLAVEQKAWRACDVMTRRERTARAALPECLTLAALRGNNRRRNERRFIE